MSSKDPSLSHGDSSASKPCLLKQEVGREMIFSWQRKYHKTREEFHHKFFDERQEDLEAVRAYLASNQTEANTRSLADMETEHEKTTQMKGKVNYSFGNAVIRKWNKVSLCQIATFTCLILSSLITILILWSPSQTSQFVEMAPVGESNPGLCVLRSSIDKINLSYLPCGPFSKSWTQSVSKSHEFYSAVATLLICTMVIFVYFCKQPCKKCFANQNKVVPEKLSQAQGPRNYADRLKENQEPSQSRLQRNTI